MTAPADCVPSADPYLRDLIAGNDSMAGIVSPCNQICAIDPATALCVGCGRTLHEIERWSAYSDAERARIMAELPRRHARVDASDATRLAAD